MLGRAGNPDGEKDPQETGFKDTTGILTKTTNLRTWPLQGLTETETRTRKSEWDQPKPSAYIEFTLKTTWKQPEK